MRFMTQINPGVRLLLSGYKGAEGGPGIKKINAGLALCMGSGLGNCVALITDGVFSGATEVRLS